MKKQLLMSILLVSSLLANAEPVEINGIYYNLIEKAKIAEVTTGNYSGDIVIPETFVYNDVTYTVTAITESAFMNQHINTIVLPNTITSIGNSAFSGSNLTSIVIPNSVTSMGSDVFYCCRNLVSVELSQNLTTIESASFDNCIVLSSIVIPEGITTINHSAFSRCSRLTSIVIPSTLSFIGTQAFLFCSSLKAVYISNLEAWCEINFNFSSYYTSDPESSNPLFYAKHLYLNGEEIENLIIPNSINQINNFAFVNCSGIKSIRFSNQNAIGERAFYGCTGLTSLTTGKNVDFIGSSAFQNCTSLNEVNIVQGQISASAFEGCISLKSITLSNECYLENRTFADCQNIENVYCLPGSSEELTQMIYAELDAFSGSYPDYATLHVPEVAYEDYRTTEPWSNFGTIKVIDGETPVVEKCATPTITYANGKVRFACETEGVEFVPSITVTPNQLQNGNELAIGGTFTVSVYAVKEGYDNSDTATMTINMSQMGDVNADGELNAADITAVVNAILGK